LIQYLVLLKVNYLAEVQKCLHHVEREFTENRVVVLQAQVRDVDLDLFAHGAIGLVKSKFLANLEEAFFYFLLNARLELLLHVVKFQILSFKVLERLI
jgi:hypothetical protein